MDKHLNLFYSYDRGSEKSLDRLKQIEDNITRSFIVTLKGLASNHQRDFLNKLMGPGSYSSLNYDLQNIDIRIDLKPDCKKYLITIGSERSVYTERDLKDIKYHKYDFEESEKIKKALKQDIDVIFKILDNEEKEEEVKQKLLRIENEYEFEGLTKYDKEINRKKIRGELSYIHNLIMGCRPDGWIYNESFIVAVESKIGQNPFNPYQLSRHIKDKRHGLGIKTDENINIINKTWDEITEIFQGLLSINNQFLDKDEFLISEFKEYIKMIQKKLDLSFIGKEDYDREIAKEQFPLLLSKFDELIKNKYPSLERSKRPLSDYLWDYYGVKGKNSKIKQDPHYSIYFDEDYAGISFTTKDILKKKNNHMDLVFSNNNFLNYLKRKLDDNYIERSRYFIGLINYRLIDWKRGKQKGQSFESFNFELKLLELTDHKEDNIKAALQQIKELKKYAKQFEFGIRILYPYGKIKVGDEALMRNQNKQLFDNTDELLKLYMAFIDDTYDIFKELVSLNKKNL